MPCAPKRFSRVPWDLTSVSKLADFWKPIRNSLGLYSARTVWAEKDITMPTAMPTRVLRKVRFMAMLPMEI